MTIETPSRSLRSRTKSLSLAMVFALLALPLAETVRADQARSRSGSSSSSSRSSAGPRSSSASSGNRHAVPRSSAKSERTPSTRHRSRGSAPSGRRIGGHFGHSYYYGYYGYGGWGSYYPYSFYAHYPFYRQYPYYPWGMVWYGEPARLRGDRAPGAFDLNVKPKKTEVYIDGEYAGTAGQFDGFPGYLWVAEGRHELVFHRPGYETVVRDVTARPGVVIDVRLEMTAGEATPPEELMVRRPPAEERTAEADRRRTQPRERRPSEERSATLDVRGEPGRFQVRVQPDDAAVYLDGRYLGNGTELLKLHSGLLVNPGSHQIEVVRPGFASKTVDFEVAAGDQVSLEVELESAGG